MSYEIYGSGRQVSENEIKEVEVELNIKLPVEYVDFLKRHNGGRPIPKFFRFRDRKGERIGQVLDFFGVDDPVESCNIKWNFEVFFARIPVDIVPIACEDGGNIICIGVALNNRGKVYYWDRYAETFSPSLENIYEIAGSFDGFMAGLFAHEIDESLLQHAMSASKD